MAKTARTPKVTKADLVREEEVELHEKAFFWFQTHQNKILGIVIVVCAVYAAIVYWNNQRENRLYAANDELFAAFRDYETALMAHPWASQERVDAMREVVSQTDLIMAEYGDTPIANNAMFLKGNAYYFAGDPINSAENTQASIDVFEEYRTVAQADGDEFEQAAALLALGYAYENLYLLLSDATALPTALDYYDRILKLDGAGFLRYEAMNALARIAAFNGDEERAKELYTEVAKARFDAVDEPDNMDDLNEREFMMLQLRQLANFFTVGQSAMVGLERLGVDTEELRAELKAESKS